MVNKIRRKFANPLWASVLAAIIGFNLRATFGYSSLGSPVLFYVGIVLMILYYGNRLHLDRTDMLERQKRYFAERYRHEK